MKMTNREKYLKYKSKVDKWKKDNPDKAHAIQVAYRRRRGQLARAEFVEIQKKNWEGKNNPNYTGKAFRTNKESWRKLALEIQIRDKFKCKFCGREKGKGMRLNVHHIIPYDISQNDNPNNLITLCQSCHLKTHHLLRREGKQLFV